MTPNNKKQSGSTPSLVFFFTILVVPFLGFLLYQKWELSLEPPPPDFGSGSMFDQIATRYDMINRFLALRMDVGWRKQMTGLLRDRLLSSPSLSSSSADLAASSQESSMIRLVDLATGTADVALQLAMDIPTATIVGIDPSQNMLQVGRDKIASHDLSNRIELFHGDARQLSHWEANSFDGATMAFGIRNVPERDVALCEIHRLLKPHGMIAILEFSEPDDSHGVLGRLARLFIRHIVPIMGGLLSGAPREYAHLQNSIQDFPTPTEFRTLMQTLPCGGGFDMDEVIHMNFGSVQLYSGRAVKTIPSSDIE